MKMNKYLLFNILFAILLSCTNTKPRFFETISNYVQAYDDSDFKTLRTLIGDTIVITSGDFKTPYSHNEFYDLFQWDSVFNPRYKLIKLEKIKNSVVAKIAMTSKKYDFLGNNPLVCNYKFGFKSGKIVSLNTTECPSANWQIWGQNVDSLTTFVRKTHPELDGFINDLTLQGALNYKKAIALYESKNK